MRREIHRRPPMDATQRELVREFFELHIPFNRFLGLRVETLDEDRGVIALPYREEFVGDPLRPALHGGVIATLLDVTGGFALWSRLGMTDRVSTVDIRVDYLRPGRLEDLHAEGKVRRIGNRMGVVAVRAYHPSSADENVAEAMAVFNIRRAKGE